MESGQVLQVASSFTSTPLEPSLHRALVDNGLPVEIRFTQYAQMSEYMLSPLPDSRQIGTLVLLRVEDWLREELKSSPPDFRVESWARQQLCTRVGEFIGQLTALSQRGKQVWFVACPSTGWISERHKLAILCRTYTNFVFARAQSLPEITTLRWPAFLFKGEFEDRGADRLGQVAFMRECFDQLGIFLGAQLSSGLTRRMPKPSAVAASGSPEFAAYLASLHVRVQLSPAGRGERAHVDRILRTAATFSLTGEKRDISDAEIDSLIESGSCMLITVSDRHCDHGPSGLLIYRSAEDALVIQSMALSCSVLGKQVEHAVLSALAQIAGERHFSKLVFEYKSSARNQPIVTFLQSVADIESDTRYVLPVGTAEARLRAAAVNAGAWTVELRSVADCPVQ